MTLSQTYKISLTNKFKGNYGHFILFGDFNARTGTQNEFVEADDFLLDELHLDALDLLLLHCCFTSTVNI